METLIIIALIIFLIYWLIISRVAEKGGGGKMGEKIRASDHRAWQYAVEDAEQRLSELKQAEPY